MALRFPSALNPHDKPSCKSVSASDQRSAIGYRLSAIGYRLSAIGQHTAVRGGFRRYGLPQVPFMALTGRPVATLGESDQQRRAAAESTESSPLGRQPASAE